MVRYHRFSNWMICLIWGKSIHLPTFSWCNVVRNSRNTTRRITVFLFDHFILFNGTFLFTFPNRLQKKVDDYSSSNWQVAVFLLINVSLDLALSQALFSNFQWGLMSIQIRSVLTKIFVGCDKLYLTDYVVFLHNVFSCF